MSGIIKRNVDVAVIGGGPAGLGAAIKARECGADKVLLIERAEELGGVLPQCIHNGFGLHYFKEELSGPAYAYKMIEKLNTSGVEVMLKTMVIDLTEEKKITAVNEQGIMEIDAKAVILCMGCRERPRGAIRIPGDRPAGVFTAGAAQRMINIEGHLPGKKILILGSGDIGMIMARRMTLEGAEVKAVVELMPFIGGLIRNEIQCLRDFDIPVYVSHTITSIKGKDRIESITIAEIDSKRKIIEGTEKEFEVDTLLLSVGLIPENELSRKAGVKLHPITGGPLVDNLWQTNVSGIFAGGNVVHVHDLADYVTESSEFAAENACKYIRGGLKEGEEIPVSCQDNIRYVVPNRIRKNGEDVVMFMRVTQPAEKVEIRVGDIYSRKLDFARPSEQIRIDLPGELIKKCDSGLIVRCVPQEDKNNGGEG